MSSLTIGLADFIFAIPGGFLLSIAMAAFTYVDVGLLAPNTTTANVQ